MIDLQIPYLKSFLIFFLVSIKSLVKFVVLEKWKKSLIVWKKIKTKVK